MDINKLLKGAPCSCGKIHTCDIKYVYDEAVYKSDFHYITIDDYMDYPKVVKPLL